MPGPELQVPHARGDDDGDEQQRAAHAERELKARGERGPGLRQPGHGRTAAAERAQIDRRQAGRSPARR